MKKSVWKIIPGLAILALAAVVILPVEGQAGGFGRFFRRSKPRTAAEHLAAGIDEIEDELNEMGTVVAKRPDIWGESRLTTHRQEVERVLAKEIDKFELLLNAKIARSDQAFLASATAIARASNAEQLAEMVDEADLASNLLKPENNLISNNTTVQTYGADGTPGGTQSTSIVGTAPFGLARNEVFGIGNGFADKGVNLEPTIRLDQLNRYLHHLQELRRLNEGGDTADAPGYALNLVRIPVSVIPGEETRIGHGASITITARSHYNDSLLPTTFRSLVVNDLVDQLSLPLVKVAHAVDYEQQELRENVLRFQAAVRELQDAARCLQICIGSQQLKDIQQDPQARQAYLNRLRSCAGQHLPRLAAAQSGVRTAACHVTRLLNQFQISIIDRALAAAADIPGQIDTILANEQAVATADSTISEINEARKKEMIAGSGASYSAGNSNPAESVNRAWESASSSVFRLNKEIQEFVDRNGLSRDNIPTGTQLLLNQASSPPAYMISPGVDPVPDYRPLVTGPDAEKTVEHVLQTLALFKGAQASNDASTRDALDQLTDEGLQTALDALDEANTQLANAATGLDAAVSSAAVTGLPSASPRARTARYAVPPSRMLCVFGERQFQIVARKLGEVLLNGCQGETIHLSDARGFLGEEIHSAYDYLSSPLGQSHWEMAGDILKAIRGGQSLLPFQEQMMTAVGGHCTEVQQSLAWAILVESILLNERLNDDLRRVAGDPECPCSFGDWYPFYLPNPGPEARRAFIDYVECRWPIHVFAVDPVTQDQNVADAFSMRREMQLAMALAFTTGQMSAQNMTRYMRRMELDMQTIALNRTVVSFGHGRDTFGWRFYPRVQTPEFDSNLTVIHRDLLVGGPKKDHLLKKHRLEPGMRELTALVIMPSFIQHLRFDVRSDYFELTDPDDTAATMGRTLELSRKIRDLERLALHCGEEADRYRIGEMERMLARVKQLSRKMPLQTLYAQVPNENTLGGFEMFSSGVTDLSPELIDYYGEPGVVPGGETKMFLVGKNFSVHETRVIAGNRDCHFDLISREIMEVTIPPNVRIVECRHKPQPGGKGGPCAGPGGCVCGTGACGTGEVEYYVDVHLATPYGVTRHLHLPVLSPRGGDVEGFTWEPENLAATYYWAEVKDKDFEVGNISSIRLGDPKELRFRVPATVQPAASLKFEAHYQVSLNPVAGPGNELPANSSATELTLPYDPAEQAYILRGENLYALHRAVRVSVAALIKAQYGKRYVDLAADAPNAEVNILLKPADGIVSLVRNYPVLQIRLVPLQGAASPGTTAPAAPAGP